MCSSDLAWFEVANAHGLQIQWNSFQSFDANELDDINQFKAMVFRKNGIETECSDLYARWKGLLSFDFHNKTLVGWAGQVYLEENTTDVVEEFYVVNGAEEVGRFGIYTTKDKNELLFYAYDGTERYIERINDKQMDEAKTLLEEIIKNNEAAGFHIKREQD